MFVHGLEGILSMEGSDGLEVRVAPGSDGVGLVIKLLWVNNVFLEIGVMAKIMKDKVRLVNRGRCQTVGRLEEIERPNGRDMGWLICGWVCFLVVQVARIWDACENLNTGNDYLRIIITI